MSFNTDSLERVFVLKSSIEGSCKKGDLTKVEYHGRAIFELRCAFFGKFLETTPWAVYLLAKSVFQTIAAGAVGLAFTNEHLRDRMVESWKDTALSLKVICAAFIGLFSPNASEWFFAKKPVETEI